MLTLKPGRERPTALFLMVLTATLWSLGGLLIKTINAHPLAIAGVRSTFASIVILLWIKKPKFTWSKDQIFAAIGYCGAVLIYVVATKATTAANAILLQSTAPIYVALLSSFMLRERVRTLDWITIAVVMGGMVLFFMDSLSAEGMFGNIMACLSGVSFAFMHVFMRRQKNTSPGESILLGNILTAVIGLPFLFVAFPGSMDWVYLSAIGIVQLGIPYVLYAVAIRHVTALEAVLLSGIEPILNPLWVFLFIGERPGMWAIVGGVIVLGAVTTRCVITVKQAKIEQQAKEALESA